MVKYSFSNSKMKHLARVAGLRLAQVVSFDLPAGWTCPKANICKTFANKETGKIQKVGSVFCYAAKGEAFSPSARRLRWHNFNMLWAVHDSADKMADLLEEALPNKVRIVRIHSSGDFFHKNYFQAWGILAARHPEIIFFGYTKILDYAKAEKPDNFYLQYSFGSKDDARLTPDVPTCYIGEYDNQYPNIQVVCGSHDAGHEDFYAILRRETFTIPVH